MDAPTLLSHLAREAIAPIARKSWFSGQYVLFGPYMWRAQSLYETGAALGYAFRDRLPVFVESFCEPGSEAATVASLAESAAAQRAQITNEPSDFLELFFKPEVERLMRVMREGGRTRYSQWSDFPKVARKKMRADDMLFNLTKTLRRGVALGGHYPELAERISARSPDPELWKRARAGSSGIPASPPEPKPLPRRQEEAIARIRPFLEEVRPELLTRLGLWVESSAAFRLRWRALMGGQTNPE